MCFYNSMSAKEKTVIIQYADFLNKQINVV